MAYAPSMRSAIPVLFAALSACTPPTPAPEAEREEPSAGEEAPVAAGPPAVGAEELERVVALIDRLGPSPAIEGAAIVTTSSWAGPHYCFETDDERRPAVTLFGAPCMVMQTSSRLGRNEVREHIEQSLEWLDGIGRSNRARAMATSGSVAVDIAGIASVVHRENVDALARALLALALRAPHESRPTPDASSLRRLEGDIALAALRDALVRYERDPELSLAGLRARLETIAQLEGLEAAHAAERLVEVLRRMEVALEASTLSPEARMIADHHSLYRVTAQDAPADAMAILLPLVDSDFRVRRVDRSRYAREDLVTLGTMALDAASQIVGRPLRDADDLRAWWAANESDQGLDEAWATLERRRAQSTATRDLGVYVARIAAVGSADAAERLERMHQRGTVAFRQQLLGSLHHDRWTGELAVRRLLRRSLESEDYAEVSAAARLLRSADERTLEIASRRLATLAREEDEAGEHGLESALSILAEMLMTRGRADAALAVWTDLPRGLRERLARMMPQGIDPARAAAALLDESTLAVDASPECSTLLAADAMASRIAASRGETFDCAAEPLARRAARAAMAGQPSPAAPPIHTRMMANASVTYEGPAALVETVDRALGHGSIDPERVRALLTALVRARPEPTMLALAILHGSGGTRVELRLRAVRTPAQLAASGVAITEGADRVYLQGVSDVVPSSASPLIHGAAPFRPLLEHVQACLDADEGRLVLQIRW